MISLVPPGFVQSKIAVGAHWLVFSEIVLTLRTIPRHGKPLLTLTYDVSLLIRRFSK